MGSTVSSAKHGRTIDCNVKAKQSEIKSILRPNFIVSFLSSNNIFKTIYEKNEINMQKTWTPFGIHVLL